MLLLVLAHRHFCGFLYEDVDSHEGGICEQSGVDTLVGGRAYDFFFEGFVVIALRRNAYAERLAMADKKEIVLSGIRSTGNLHLGNYYGALSKFVRMQDDYDCNFFIADLHALTTNPDPRELHANVKNILAEYLAAGIDPEKSTIFIQSDVPEIAEMYLLLNMHVGIGELMRTASFKDKARKALGIGVPAQGDDDEAFEKEIIGAFRSALFPFCQPL